MKRAGLNELLLEYVEKKNRSPLAFRLKKKVPDHKCTICKVDINIVKNEHIVYGCIMGKTHLICLPCNDNYHLFSENGVCAMCQNLKMSDYKVADYEICDHCCDFENIAGVCDSQHIICEDCIYLCRRCKKEYCAECNYENNRKNKKSICAKCLHD